MANEKGILYIARIKGRTDSLKPYDIYINGIKKGSIESGDIFSRKLSVGEYKLQLGMDWYKTEEVTVKVEANETSYIACESNMRGWKLSNLITLFGGKRGIIITKISEDKVAKIKEQKSNITDKTIVELAMNASCGIYDQKSALGAIKIQSILFGILVFIVNLGTQFIFDGHMETLLRAANAALFGVILGMVYYLFSKSRAKMWDRQVGKTK